MLNGQLRLFAEFPGADDETRNAEAKHAEGGGFGNGRTGNSGDGDEGVVGITRSQRQSALPHGRELQEVDGHRQKDW